MRIATIIGTFQSTLTNFRYIRKQWGTNAEEERLLGVSLTGIMDHPLLSNSSRQTENLLKELKEETIAINKFWAEKLSIPQSVATSTIKPSGTVSQLVDSASGIHPRHSECYIRTIRADVKDPLAVFLQEQGVPNEVDVTNASNVVFSFPVAAPKDCITRNERTAVEALEHYLVYKRMWCEHNPSITVYVKEHEWMEVGAWVYQHLDDIGGVSFLPHSEHIYQQAPYQDITKEQYETLRDKFPKIEWEKFDSYEQEDNTTASHELSCTGGVCELP